MPATGEKTKHFSKGGRPFSTCSGCLNYRPMFWLPAGWSGAAFCPACASRIWQLASSNWKQWQAQNLTYLAGLGWHGQNPTQ
jgi:hypothetical protein